MLAIVSATRDVDLDQSTLIGTIRISKYIYRMYWEGEKVSRKIWEQMGTVHQISGVHLVPSRDFAA